MSRDHPPPMGAKRTFCMLCKSFFFLVAQAKRATFVSVATMYRFCFNTYYCVSAWRICGCINLFRKVGCAYSHYICNRDLYQLVQSDEGPFQVLAYFRSCRRNLSFLATLRWQQRNRASRKCAMYRNRSRQRSDISRRPTAILLWRIFFSLFCRNKMFKND